MVSRWSGVQIPSEAFSLEPYFIYYFRVVKIMLNRPRREDRMFLLMVEESGKEFDVYSLHIDDNGPFYKGKPLDLTEERGAEATPC